MGLSGLHQAAVAVLKQAAENLPPEIKDNILQIGRVVADFKVQLDRIEARQVEILKHLTGEIEHGPVPRINDGTQLDPDIQGDR